MRTPPGPSGLEALQFFGGGSLSRALTFLERTARRYGPISSFRVLGKRIFLIDDAELIKQILVTDQHHYTRDNGATLLRELVGDGLLTSEEPRHKERRRILQPAFHRAQIATYAESMVIETERMSNTWQSGSEIDAGLAMKRLTLAIVGASLFGADFSRSADSIAEVLQRVIRRSTWITPAITLFEPALKAYRRMRPGARSVFFDAERRELEAIIEPIIEKRRITQTKDVLSLLLNQRDDRNAPLTAEDIRNEIVTLVLAGHETTATALTWAWHLISTHPAVEERLHAEIDSVLDQRMATLEDVPRLEYTSMVFNEALRLYPPAFAFGRRPSEDVELAGYTIPRGCSIFLSPYVTHRNERYFPQPDQFLPERWQAAAPPKFAYFPFGAGAKMCIGDAFARMEGILILATIGRRWSLQAVGEGQVGLSPGVTLRPDKPVLMRAVPRPV